MMTAAPVDPEATNLPESPHAMAQAVLDEAIAKRDRQTDRSSTAADAPMPDGAREDDPSTSDKRPRMHTSNADRDGTHATKSLKTVWERARSKEWTGDESDEALAATTQLVLEQIESLIQSGVEAFHRWESTNRTLLQAREENESNLRELKRLRASEEQSRATITNLLRTVETSKSDARDASRVVQVEARLRADISALRAERNDALASAAESKRKATLLEEDVRSMKTKLSRVVQDKIKMERDSRAAISLARSLDSHASSDCEFYKRKVAELTNHLQTQQALVAEQKHQMEEMRRQMERSMSQNRLANIRAETGKAHKRSI